MKLLWLLLAGCAVEPAEASWNGRWTDGFHGLVVQACEGQPFLAIDFDHTLLFALRTDAHHAEASLAFLPVWSGGLVLDGDQLHAEIGDVVFTAARVAGVDGDPSNCPPSY